MQKIPLRKSRAYTVVSEEDAVWARQWRWSRAKNGYVVRYHEVDGKCKTIFLHREIMRRMLGYDIPSGLQVDHIERDKLLNTRSALRLATRSQNQANKGRARNNTSQYKGVSCNQGKFEARIHFQEKRIHLGRFDNPELAARYYDCASRVLY